MKLFNQTGEGFCITGKCLYVNRIPSEGKFKEQLKVGLQGNFCFYLPIDAPGAGRFVRDYIVTVHASTLDSACSNGKTYINLKGNIRIMDIKEPIIITNSKFDALPMLDIQVSEKKVKKDTALSDDEDIDI